MAGEDIKFLKLHCSKICYNENREITTLELTDEKGNVRYKFGNKKTEEQQQMTDEQKMMREVAMKDVESAKSVDGLEDVWKSNILLHTDNEFKNAVIKKKAELL